MQGNSGAKRPLAQEGLLAMTQFSSADPVMILSFARTPMGSMQGALADVSATQLGATAVRGAVERAGVAGEKIERIYMGCVLPAGLGQAPARQAGIGAGLPTSVQATTVSKVCGSGMQALIMGAEALASGSVDCIVAGETVVDTDEAPGKGRPDKIPGLKPAFAQDGTITAATSSSISDGAAALVLTRASVAEADGLKPIARVVAMAAHAQAPKDFTTAPVGAINALLAKAGWNVADVDLFEVNEAFACVAMFAMHDLGIPHEKINVHGGATALGHPIGASGARIITTLIGALQRHGKTRGVASLCIGGGEATAVAIELV